jgi:putative addiction module component (TIGR02574 family)
MGDNAAKLLEEALRLPAEARAALAASLLDSLDNALDPDAEAQWDAEIGRRVKELDEGKVRPIPWAEARRQLFRS